MNGPQKVVSNLLDSLNQENIPYSINEEKYKYNFIIQYDWLGHEKHSKLDLENCVIGPQIWMFDDHVSVLRDNPHYYKSIIAPSDWVKNKYITKFGFPENKISVWPVGIKISNLNKNIKYDCLLYCKRRSQEELDQVIKFLESKNMTYNVVSYGNYNESDLELLSSQSRFCFLLNGTESQGIAVQEIMSNNTPLIVWDLAHWNDQGPQWSVPATSIPYWDPICGEKFFSVDDLEKTFQKFYSNIGKYNPCKYIEENLSYQVSVKKLLNIFRS